MNEDKVCVVGLGYVGLTFALTIVESGVETLGVDRDKKLLSTLKKRKSHFFERGIDYLVRKHINGLFNVSDDIKDDKWNVFIISVGTPVTKGGEPILSHIHSSADIIAKVLKRDDLVILRSTVPVGTTRDIVIPILEKKSRLKAGTDFSVVFAPERTIEGRALKELRELPQIIGAIDEKSFIRASNLFRKSTPTVIRVSSLESAEMIKILDNTYRDLNFAISNEIYLICDKLGLDAYELIKAANLGYNRNNMPMPSPGVGGACLVKDPYIFLGVASKVDHESVLVKKGREINEYMPVFVAKKVIKFIRSRKLKNPKIFIMGYAFKGRPLTSDMRNSPTIDLIAELKKRKCRIYGYDPAVSMEDIENTGSVYCKRIEEGFKNTDCVIVMLNHDEYEDLDVFELFNLSHKPVFLYNGWQVFNPKDIKLLKHVVLGG